MDVTPEFVALIIPDSLEPLNRPGVFFPPRIIAAIDLEARVLDLPSYLCRFLVPSGLSVQYAPRLLRSAVALQTPLCIDSAVTVVQFSVPIALLCRAAVPGVVQSPLMPPRVEVALAVACPEMHHPCTHAKVMDAIMTRYHDVKSMKDLFDLIWPITNVLRGARGAPELQTMHPRRLVTLYPCETAELLSKSDPVSIVAYPRNAELRRLISSYNPGLGHRELAQGVVEAPPGLDAADLFNAVSPGTLLAAILHLLEGPLVVSAHGAPGLASRTALLIARVATAAFCWLGITLPLAPVESVVSVLMPRPIAPAARSVLEEHGLPVPLGPTTAPAVCATDEPPQVSSLPGTCAVLNLVTGTLEAPNRKIPAKSQLDVSQAGMTAAKKWAEGHRAGANDWTDLARGLRVALTPALFAVPRADLLIRFASTMLASQVSQLQFLVPLGSVGVGSDSAAAVAPPFARAELWAALRSQRWFGNFLNICATDPFFESVVATAPTASTSEFSAPLAVHGYRIGQVRKVWQPRVFVLTPGQRVLQWYVSGENDVDDDASDGGDATPGLAAAEGLKLRGEMILGPKTYCLSFERPRGVFPGATDPPAQCQHFGLLMSGDSRVLIGFSSIESRANFFRAIFFLISPDFPRSISEADRAKLLVGKNVSKLGIVAAMSDTFH